MKAYSMDLRIRIAEDIKSGECPKETALRYKVSLRSVYRYAEADRKGRLEPRKREGKWRKLDPEKLKEAVAATPDATLDELGARLGVCRVAVWQTLGKLGITLKKKRNSTRRGTKSSAASTGWNSGTRRRSAP